MGSESNFDRTTFPMMAQPLPYDMGNAGDLMKHGLLAEFTHWRCRTRDKAIRFADPFGGRPWVEPPIPIVTERVKLLSGFALSAAQPHPEERYYGSGHVVRRVVDTLGQSAEVWVSDREPRALRDLLRSGLAELKLPGFDAADGYSILETKIDADLILIDPFASFVSDEAPIVLPKISKRSADAAIVLFVLIRDPTDADGRRYAALKAQHLAHAWTLGCPPLHNTGVRGEGNYTMEVLLTAPKLLMQSTADMLGEQLKKYAERLTDVFATRVTFSTQCSTGVE
jgi:hypothetical protein